MSNPTYRIEAGSLEDAIEEYRGRRGLHLVSEEVSENHLVGVYDEKDKKISLPKEIREEFYMEE